MANCPQCVGERKDPYSPLVSTIRYNRRAGYMFCKTCGRRWALAKPNKVLHTDAAMPPSVEPDPGLESVPAVESDTQPRW